MLTFLKELIWQSDTKSGKLFDLTIVSLIIYSIVSLSIETLPDISPQTESFLEKSNIVVTVIFTIEYLLRILTCDKKRSYIFGFYGVIDLLSILPFYLALGFDLRGLRIFRIFRLFRILKVSRYTKALAHFLLALKLAKEEIIIFLIATTILLYLSSLGIYYFEHSAQPEVFRSIFDALWWAVATLTTVGYGDIYPITTGGRIFTFFILVIGLGIVAVPAGIISSALSATRGRKGDEP